MRALGILLCLMLVSSAAYARIDTSACTMKLEDYIKHHQEQLDFSAKLEEKEQDKISELQSNIARNQTELSELAQITNPSDGKKLLVKIETLTATLKASEAELKQHQALVGTYLKKDEVEKFKANPQAFQLEECTRIQNSPNK